jgi:hypothetical protein
VLLVTGPVTHNMKIALERAYAVTPNPRAKLLSSCARHAVGTTLDLWIARAYNFSRSSHCTSESDCPIRLKLRRCKFSEQSFDPEPDRE